MKSMENENPTSMYGTAPILFGWSRYQPTLVLEERPQHLGNRKDDLAMRDIPKQPFPHPFAPYLDALGLA